MPIFPILLGLGALITFGALFRRGGGAPDPQAGATPKNPKKISSDILTFTFDGTRVLETPQKLAADASKKLGFELKPGELALATAMTSEAGGLPKMAQIGVGWTIINYTRKVLKKDNPYYAVAPDGKFARQGAPSHSYVASSRPPSRAIILLAKDVMYGKYSDPTKGAVQFDSPAAQLALMARDPLYKSSPQKVAASRQSEGKKKVLIPGVPEEKMRFWAYA